MKLVAVAVLLASGVGPTYAKPQLTKQDVKPALKQLVPMLTRCYVAAQRRKPSIRGVVNTRFAVTSTRERTRVVVKGFDTAGELGESKPFRSCVIKTVAAAKLPSSGEGTIELLYPITFAPTPPDNADTTLFDQAKQAAAKGDWSEALAKAERGLESTSIDGTVRRPLIAIAGVAACHLSDQTKARHYTALASPNEEREIRDVCKLANVEL
ncbi:MAG TPA: hypothetical protein VIV40_38430 [Kofleriaceae bacterium]